MSLFPHGDAVPGEGNPAEPPADQRHPANHLRGSMLAARPQLSGLLKLSEDEWAAIDAELVAAHHAVARQLVAST